MKKNIKPNQVTLKEKERKPEPISLKVLFINLILFVFILLMGSKFYIVNKYDIDADTVSLHNSIAFDLIYLSSDYEVYTVNYDESDYLYFENIKLLNVFDGFEKTNNSDESVTYTLYDESKNKETSLTISITNNVIYELNKEYSNKSYTYFDLVFKNASTNDLVSEYLYNNEIYCETDLLKSLNEEFNTNFLTNTDDLKTNYSIGYLVNLLFTNGDKTLITGDYTGYMDTYYINDEVYTLYVITIEDINYEFTFYKSDYYTENELNNIINSLIIT